MRREKLVTVVVILGIFGGLVGGPVASLIDYMGSPEERFRLFVIPEIIGFISAGFMIYLEKSKRNRNK